VKRLAVLVTALALPLATAVAPAQAATTRASFTQVENDVMCVVCHEPLAEAKSPQAFSERAYIRQLIAQGLTKRQIERELVVQYGPAILAKPPASGFNILLYVVPPVLLAAGIAMLVLMIPRWRRRARAAPPLASGPGLDPEDARRLEQDLTRRA
jgi:cytochrome c-type biogenesis protein CcmH